MDKKIASLEVNGIQFEQEQMPSGGVLTKANSYKHKFFATVYDFKNWQQVQVNLFTNGCATADEYLIPGLGQALNLKFDTENGSAQSLTIVGISATDLINALEAARMANVVQPEGHLAE